MQDPLGRIIDYLRISVTENCNFRCGYCVPAEGLPCSQRDLLTPKEISRIGRIACELGFCKFRLTGGEPLLRKDIIEITQGLAELYPQPQIAMTTNGYLLKEKLTGLKKAGLTHLNISLDSLDPKRFESLTRKDVFHRVWNNILSALDAGFQVKINVVVLRGMTAEDILQFVRLAQEKEVEVRFLEFMPLCGSSWNEKAFYPIPEVRALIQKNFSLLPIPQEKGQTASVFRLSHSKGKIGFIASYSEPFCQHCNRLRISSKGTIRPCLFSDLSFDLRPALEQKEDHALRDMFYQAVLEKPKGHQWNSQRPLNPEQFPLIHNIGG